MSMRLVLKSTDSLSVYGDDSIVGERQKPLLRHIVLENDKNLVFFAPLSGAVTHQ